MALSDCIRCDDTPCTCGFDGYLAVYPTKPEHCKRLPYLTGAEIERIKTRLRFVLDAELARADLEMRTDERSIKFIHQWKGRMP